MENQEPDRRDLFPELVDTDSTAPKKYPEGQLFCLTSFAQGSRQILLWTVNAFAFTHPTWSSELSLRV